MSDSKIAAWPRPQDEDEIRGLLERARVGDPTDLASLRLAMDRHPEIWRAYGDLAAHARDAWIDLIAGADLGLKESLGRQAGSMKAELAGPAPSPLEALLVERIAACWLQVYYCDAAAAQAGEMSIQQGNYLRKRQDSAHRRYLTAVGALAMTRRLLGSALGGSGRGPKIALRSTGSVGEIAADGARDGLGEPGAILMEDEPAEEGLVLEFPLPGAGESGKRVTGRRRRGKI